jgi:hypothetical protein
VSQIFIKSVVTLIAIAIFWSVWSSGIASESSNAEDGGPGPTLPWCTNDPDVSGLPPCEESQRLTDQAAAQPCVGDFCDPLPCEFNPHTPECTEKPLPPLPPCLKIGGCEPPVPPGEICLEGQSDYVYMDAASGTFSIYPCNETRGSTHINLAHGYIYYVPKNASPMAVRISQAIAHFSQLAEDRGPASPNCTDEQDCSTPGKPLPLPKPPPPRPEPECKGCFCRGGCPVPLPF